MVLQLKRFSRESTYTEGRMSIDGALYCDTLEPRDRCHFGEEVIEGDTAIPAGEYPVDLNTVSESLYKKWFYQTACEGLVPRLKDLPPHFSAVHIRAGNAMGENHSSILVGRREDGGRLTVTRATFLDLMDRYLIPARLAGEEVRIVIK